MTIGGAISASDLADFRAHGEEMLVDTCIISRPGTVTPDNAGGVIRGSATFITAPCLMFESGLFQEGYEAPAGGALRPMVTRSLFLRPSQDVRPTDRIIYSGVSYEIVEAAQITQTTGLRVVRLKKP